MLSSLLTTYAAEVAEPIIKWVLIGWFAAVLVAGVVILCAKKSIFEKYAKCALVATTFVALIAGLVMLVLEIVKHFDKGYLEENWVNNEIVTLVLIPLLVVVFLLLVTTVVLVVLRKNSKAFKLTSKIAGGICGAALVAALVCIAVYYGRHIQADGYYSKYLNSTALYLLAAGLIIVEVVVAFVVDRNNKTVFDSHCIALAGITIALSFALSYVSLWKMPQGGTVTLASLLPVMVFAYLYGPKKGLIIGLIYGTLQALQDPYIIHPAQFLLDYPIAFSMIAFTGVFADIKGLDGFPQIKFVLGGLVASIGRFISHVLSGVFAFGAYAGETNVWIYSLAYNSFVFVDIVIVLVIGCLLFSSPTFVRQAKSYVKQGK